MNKEVIQYTHDDWVGSFADVLKHVVLHTVIRELQKEKSQGLLLVDAFCGDGVFDLNQHDNPTAYQKGILKVLQKYETSKDTGTVPIPVKEFIENYLYPATGCSNSEDLDVYPGSPVLLQKIARKTDEIRLIDKNVEEVQWINNQSEIFQSMDTYNTQQSMEYILPYTDPDDGLHPVIFVDPSYEDDTDFGKTKKLVQTILDQHPYATVLVFIPMIQNHTQRWSYPSGMRELAKTYAKTGRYFCSININKDKYQGCAMLVCNPTKHLDDILDDTCVHWLANTMNEGKDEYMVEQTMKKKKS